MYSYFCLEYCEGFKDMWVSWKLSNCCPDSLATLQHCLFSKLGKWKQRVYLTECNLYFTHFWKWFLYIHYYICCWDKNGQPHRIFCLQKFQSHVVEFCRLKSNCCYFWAFWRWKQSWQMNRLVENVQNIYNTLNERASALFSGCDSLWTLGLGFSYIVWKEVISAGVCFDCCWWWP